MGWFGWRESKARGVLVAGRAYDCESFTRSQILALAVAVDALAVLRGARLVVVPADADLTDENSSDEDQAFCRVFIGVLVAEGGADGPHLVKREAMLAGLHDARATPRAVWDEVAAAYRRAGGEGEIEDEIALRLGCTGGLPEAKLAFGQLGARHDAKGGVYIHGQSRDPGQHEVGVHGVLVAGCSYDTAADPVDVSDAAHAARAAASPNGAYYLVAQSD